MRQSRDKDAEQFFRQALTIDNKDAVALRMLSELRLRAGDTKEALELAKRATAIPKHLLQHGSVWQRGASKRQQGGS
jgi:tetratricopeptide (TPR) repeat protein